MCTLAFRALSSATTGYAVRKIEPENGLIRSIFFELYWIIGEKMVSKIPDEIFIRNSVFIDKPFGFHLFRTKEDAFDFVKNMKKEDEADCRKVEYKVFECEIGGNVHFSHSYFYFTKTELRETKCDTFLAEEVTMIKEIS